MEVSLDILEDELFPFVAQMMFNAAVKQTGHYLRPAELVVGEECELLSLPLDKIFQLDEHGVFFSLLHGDLELGVFRNFYHSAAHQDLVSFDQLPAVLTPLQLGIPD